MKEKETEEIQKRRKETEYGWYRAPPKEVMESGRVLRVVE